MKKYHVKKGDKVKVNSGNFRGEEATVAVILPAKDRVVLQFVDNKDRGLGKRTIKKSKANPNGGLIERSVSVHVSNVNKIGEAEAPAEKAEK